MSFGLGGGMTPWVQRLVIANAVVFVLQLTVPGITGLLEFVPGAVLSRPWTIVTYMFLHGGFGHIFFNMLGLFFFGPPIESRWGSSEFIKYYLICGLGGAALSFLFLNSPIIGASAAVYGVMLAFAMNWPDAPIYIWGIFPIPAKILVGIAAVMSVWYTVGGGGGDIAHAAHLGGFAAGYIYIKLDMKRGGIFSKARNAMTRRKMTVTQGGAVGSPRPAAAPGRPRAPGGIVQEEKLLTELDRVLDKISTHGMNSLTLEERKLLDEASRRYRQN